MQRKNSILNRSGIAMIMAIFVIVIISTILAISISLSSQMSQKTTNLYLYEQSVLLSRSATEYKMLLLSQSANPCTPLATNFVYDGIYTVNITTQFIPAAATTCAVNSAGNQLGITSDFVAPNGVSLDGTVIMDVTVTANPAGTTEPVRYFRRSIQKL
ncbi:hypothetical protein [Sulfurimonas sp.]|uniref:hypothetical protein n=1 Tax=Sulfurimonas sp. TaxID=2022749 RepID=UPI003D0EF6CE